MTSKVVRAANHAAMLNEYKVYEYEYKVYEYSIKI